MMQAVLDLCEEKIVIIDDYDLNMEIPNNIMPIEIAPPNDMRSDAGDLLFKRHPIILSMVDDNSGSVTNLKIRDEIFLKYGPNINEVLNAKEKNTMFDRENTEGRFLCNNLKF